MLKMNKYFIDLEPWGIKLYRFIDVLKLDAIL